MNKPNQVDYVPRSVIEWKLLTALEDKGTVAALFSKLICPTTHFDSLPATLLRPARQNAAWTKTARKARKIIGLCGSVGRCYKQTTGSIFLPSWIFCNSL